MTPMPAGRLLIVDDDEATTQTFAHILSMEGYDVRTATNAEIALREAETLHPDAIILDLRMPFINGLGLLYRFRAGKELVDTPVMIVTGDQCLDDGLLNELRELGARVRYKPLWLEDLIEAARELVAARSTICAIVAGIMSCCVLRTAC